MLITWHQRLRLESGCLYKGWRLDFRNGRKSQQLTSGRKRFGGGRLSSSGKEHHDCQRGTEIHAGIASVGCVPAD